MAGACAKGTRQYEASNVARERGYEQGDRMLFAFQYARDYARVVFERHCKRYGRLSEVRAMDKLRDIETRWLWGSNAHLRMPATCYEIAGGDFCPVGGAGYVEGSHYYKQPCPRCDAPMFVTKGVVRSARKLEDLWPMPEHECECTDPQCSEARAFMKGIHPLASDAHRLKVPLKRPLTAHREAYTPALKHVIAAAGLLAFVARYTQAKNKETQYGL